jgi:hypothetical protein
MILRLLLVSLVVSGLGVAYAEDELPEVGAQKVQRVDTTGHPLPGELRHFNFQTSPIGLMARRFNASMDIGVGKSFALGIKGTNVPQATSSDLFNTTSGYEVGGRATWYATSDRFTDGLIFRGGIYYKNTQTRHDFEDAIGDALVKAFTLGLASSDGVTVDVVNGPAFELMGGYQMVLANGINFDWNIGLTSYEQYSKVVNLKSGSDLVYDSRTWQVRPVIEVNVGIAL